MTTIEEEIFVSDSDDDSIIIIPYQKPLPPTIDLLDSDHENIDDNHEATKETPENEKPKKKHHRKDKNKNRGGKESPNKSNKRKAHKRNNSLVEELFSVLDVPTPSSSTDLIVSRNESSIVASTNVISGGDHGRTTSNVVLANNNQKSANGTDNRTILTLSRKDYANSDQTGRASSKEAKDSSTRQSLSSTSKKNSPTTSIVSFVSQTHADNTQATQQLKRPKFTYELTEAQKKNHPRLQEILNERMKEKQEQELLNNKNKLSTKKKSRGGSNSTKKVNSTRRKKSQNFDAEFDHALFLKTLNLEGSVGLNDAEIQALASSGTTLRSKSSKKCTSKGSSKISKNLNHENKSPPVRNVVDVEKSMEKNHDAAREPTGQQQLQQQQSNELHNKQKRKQRLDEKSKDITDGSNREDESKRRKTNEVVEITAPPSDLNCSEFPDCKNINEMGNACYKVDLSREEHRLLLQMDKDAKIIKKLSDQFSQLDVSISLLRKSPQVHLSGKDYDDVRDKIFALMYKLKTMGSEKCVEFIMEEYSSNSKSKSAVPAAVQNTSTFVSKGNSHTTTTKTQEPPRNIVRRITNENALGLKNKRTAKEELTQPRSSVMHTHPFSLPPPPPPLPSSSSSVSRTVYFPTAPATRTQITIDTTHDIDERMLSADARANVMVPLFSPTSPFYYPLGHADYVRQQHMMVPGSSASFNMDSFANDIIADDSIGFFIQPQTVLPPTEITPTLVEGQDFIRPSRSSSTNCVPSNSLSGWTERHPSSAPLGTVGSYSGRPFHGQPHNRGGGIWR